MLFFPFPELQNLYGLLFIVVLPLAFEFGGRAAGLALSAAFLMYYGILGITRVLLWKRKGFLAVVPKLISLAQPILIPYIIYHTFRLTYSSLLGERDHTSQLPIPLKVYGAFLGFCSPVFAIGEGLATILVMEAGRKVVKKRRRLQVPFLIGAIIVYIMCGYFITLLYQTQLMDMWSATFVGVALTSTIAITVGLFVAQKAVVTDTALMLLYVTYCIWMMSSKWEHEHVDPTPENDLAWIEMLKLRVFAVTNLNVNTIISYTVDYIENTKFFSGLDKAFSLEVFLGLLYRVLVMYGAIHLVRKRLRESAELSEQEGTEEPKEEESVESGESSEKLVNVVTALAAPLVIAVYTHVLLCHYGFQEGTSLTWRWVNVFMFLLLHTSEILYSDEEDDDDDWDFDDEPTPQLFDWSWLNS